MKNTIPAPADKPKSNRGRKKQIEAVPQKSIEEKLNDRIQAIDLEIKAKQDELQTAKDALASYQQNKKTLDYISKL